MTESDLRVVLLLRSALLGYLAVAHHGRGRGDWHQGDAAPAWIAAVDAALPPPSDAALTAPPDFVAAQQALLAESSVALLLQLYPDAAVWAGLGRA